MILPQVVDGMPDREYHADPVDGGSLSSSGARLLVSPGCPAKFRAWLDGPPEIRHEFDVGSAAHSLALGAGARIHVIQKAPDVPADSMRTNFAKDDAAAARARGDIPLMQSDYEQVQAMVRAIEAHPQARALLMGDGGVSERSLFWVEDAWGVSCRARIDRWAPLLSGRFAAVDYKTTGSVLPRKIVAACRDYGYWQQADFYLRGIRATGLASDAPFLFVFQEKTPPYMIQIVQLVPQALAYGHWRNEEALERYRDCTATGVWPGYEHSDGILNIELPPYLENEMNWND